MKLGKKVYEIFITRHSNIFQQKIINLFFETSRTTIDVSLLDFIIYFVYDMEALVIGLLNCIKI